MSGLLKSLGTSGKMAKVGNRFPTTSTPAAQTVSKIAIFKGDSLAELHESGTVENGLSFKEKLPGQRATLSLCYRGV